MPCGHPAFGVYTVPHYDVHVYYITTEERESRIGCAESPPAPVCPDTEENQGFFNYPIRNMPNGFEVDVNSGVPTQVSLVAHPSRIEGRHTGEAIALTCRASTYHHRASTGRTSAYNLRQENGTEQNTSSEPLMVRTELGSQPNLLRSTC